MRRSISLVLVAAMLLSVMIFTVPSASAAAETEPKLDWGNSYATAYYFGGTVDWHEVTGSAVDGFAKAKADEEATEPEINFRKEPTTDDKIKLDGTIEPGEWGKKSLSVSSEYAGRSSGKNGQRNPDMDEPAKDNAYYFMNFKSESKKYYEMQFDAYFLWDEEFFYMAVDVLDSSGYYNLKQSAQEGAWNGDAVQFRIDPDGPNSIVGGTGYDAKVTPRPWKRSEMKNGYQERYSEFPNFVISLTQPKDEQVSKNPDIFVERWDAAQRYNVVEVEDGGKTYREGTQMDVAQGAYDANGIAWDPVYASVTTKKVDGLIYRTQYEIAVPWEYMDSAADIIASGDYFEPKVGMQLGMALSVFDGQKGAKNGYASSLSWGNGVTGDASYHHYEMDGGSNCLILDGTPFREADICEHETFADPTCESGYKCTNCGYEMGLSLGHTFTYSDATLPTKDATGSILGTCTTCGTKVKRTLPKTEYEELASFKATDTDLTMLPKAFDSTTEEEEAARSGWTKMWTYSQAPNEGVPYKDPVTGKNRNAYEVWNKEAVANLTYPGFTGTAFYGDTFNDCLSFSQAMDIYMTGYSYATENGNSDVDNSNNMYGESGYTTGIYTTYGGNEKNGYNGGLFYIPADDQYYFALIRANRDENSKVHNSEQFEKWALAYKKVSKEEAADFMNNWHNLKFVYDDTTQTGFVFWDGELQVAGFIPLAKHKRSDNSNPIIMRTFDVQFYAKNIVWERLKTGDPIPEVITRPGEEPSTFKATINGTVYEYAAGTEVSLNADAFYLKDGNWGYRFEAWTGDVDAVADVNASTTTFTMPAKDVTITPKHYLVGDVSGVDGVADGVVDALDAYHIIQMSVNKETPTLVGDIAGTGSVDAMSVSNIAAYIVGKYIPTK